MSEKKDERDIDEILASIDAMLAQKDDKPLDDSRKNSVKEALLVSESKLSLSSSAETPQPQAAESQAFDDIDVGDFITLGLDEADLQNPTLLEDDTAPAANDALTKQDLDEVSQDELVQNEQQDDEQTQGEQTQDEKNLNAHPLIADDSNDVDTTTEDTASEQDKPTSEAPVREDKAEPESTPDLNVIEDDKGADETEDTDAEKDGSENDAENIMPQRILLTEELLEPSAQEALPLWVEQDESNLAFASENKIEEKTEQEAQDKNIDEAPEQTSSDSSLSEASATESTSSSSKAEEPSKILSDHAVEKEDKEAILLDFTDETPLDEADTELLSNIAEDLESLPNPSVESKLKPVERRVDDTLESKPKDDAFENVFDEIASDNTITFDIEEDIGIDTVYKLESLPDNTELVEAMLDDVLDEESSSSEKDKAMPELSALTTPFDDESIKALVQLVSDDIATQVNEHLQTWLPGLIKTSIKKHLNKINNQ